MDRPPQGKCKSTERPQVWSGHVFGLLMRSPTDRWPRWVTRIALHVGRDSPQVATLRDQLAVANRRADRAEQARDRLQSELAGAQEVLAGEETRLREAEAARAEF